ncbi:MAG: hypothetical protein V4773_06925 [Verrucomicrobiota bacterium]
MTAARRFALHVLVPPAGGSVFIVVALVILQDLSFSPDRFFLGVIGMLPFAYAFATIPSLFYAVIMYVAARSGIVAGSRWAILLSAGVGAFVSFSPFVIYGLDRAERFFVLLFTAGGFVVGLVLEGAISLFARRGARDQQPAI